MVNYYAPGYQTQQIMRGFNTLAESLFPNPAREAQALYYASGARHNTARAADQELVTQGRRGLSGVFAGGGDPREAYAQAALAGADVMNVLPGTMLGYRAALPDATPEGLANLQLGARMAWNQTAPGAREHEAAATQRSHIAAGPGYASVAENRRQWNETPVTMMGPNSVPVPVLRGDLAAGRLPPGVVPIVTEDQVQGNVASRMAQGQDVPNGLTVLAPAQAAANAGAIARDNAVPVMVVGPNGLRTTARGERAPTEVIIPNNEPREAAQTAALIGAPIPDDRLAAAQAAGAAMPSGRPGAARVNDVSPTEAGRMAQAIQAQILSVTGAGAVDPGVLSQLTSQATAIYQRTGDAQAAVEAVMAPLRANAAGFDVSGTWNPFATNTVRGLPRPAAPAAAPPTVAPAGAAAPAAPPEGMRVVGRSPDGRTVYSDPQGRLFAQ